MKWGLIQKCVPLICCAAMLACASREQGTAYTTENAHSHNDYEQKLPFKHAFDAGFGSIEVDVFLREGELFVAHDAEDIRPERTLKADRKSTRLNSSHVKISYAVFCLKK